MKNVLITLGVVAAVLIVGAGAFYFGQNSAERSKEMTTTPTPTVVSQSTQENQTPTPQTTGSEFKTIEAGGVLSFPLYTVTIPTSWSSQREQGQDSDKLTLTKGAYKITISEAAFGGGGCLYPGDAPSEFSQNYSVYVEIQNPNGYIFRRSQVNAGEANWTLCQKNASDGSFGTPTMFGHISIATPQVADAPTMTEIDSIFTSLSKK